MDLFVFPEGAVILGHHLDTITFLSPMARFFTQHRVHHHWLPSRRLKNTWKGIYLMGPVGIHNPHEELLHKKYSHWFRKNPHFQKWLDTPTAMLAPRKYILPELKKILVVSPRRFGAHFMPSYKPHLLMGLRRAKRQASIRVKRLRPTFCHPGLMYLIAHCHGVTTPFLCEWTGKEESQILKDILEAVGLFANSAPYWIWAHNVDMNSIPFPLKKVPKGNTSKSHFKNRLRIWHELNYIPQFVAPTAIKKVIPPYLNSFSAMSNLPKKSRPTKPVDKLFYAVPTKKRISKFPNEEWRAYDFSSRSW